MYNDAALGIAALLEAGVRKVAYVDVDAHHGDGVQAAFDDDPRVLTISIHQSPLTLFPGTGWAPDCGTGPAWGTSVNLPVPPGTDDAAWLRAFHAVVPAVVRAFKPEVLVTQHGADTHREDPLTDLDLTVDGATYVIPGAAGAGRDGHRRAVARVGGGGGYSPVRVVPRAWTHLLAIVSGNDIDPTTPIPPACRPRPRPPGPKPPAHRHVRRHTAPGALPAVGRGR